MNPELCNSTLECPDRGSDDDASQTRQAHVEAYGFQPQIGNRHDITWSGNNHPTIQFSIHFSSFIIIYHHLSSFIIIYPTIQRKTPREPVETDGNWRDSPENSAAQKPICHGTALRASGCGEGGPPPRWNGRWGNSANSTGSRHQTNVSEKYFDKWDETRDETRDETWIYQNLRFEYRKRWILPWHVVIQVVIYFDNLKWRFSHNLWFQHWQNASRCYVPIKVLPPMRPYYRCWYGYELGHEKLCWHANQCTRDLNHTAHSLMMIDIC